MEELKTTQKSKPNFGEATESFLKKFTETTNTRQERIMSFLKKFEIEFKEDYGAYKKGQRAIESELHTKVYVEELKVAKIIKEIVKLK